MTIGGYLSLYNNQLTEITFPEGMTIGGDLYLGNNQLTEITFPEGMTIGGCLYLYNNQLTEITFPEGMTIGGYLSLYNNQLTEISFPEGMTIGGGLYLSNNQLTEISFPEGMTIGGGLYLSNNQLTEISFPEGMTIGGGLYLDNNQLTEKPDMSRVNRNAPEPMMWEWRGRKFIKADGIFQLLVERRGNVCHVKSIGSGKISYLVTDGNGKWAHGDTIAEAKKDLIYKIANRDKSKYEGWTKQTEVSFEEAIEAYRVITGACAAGTRGFVERVLPESEKRDRYTIAEVIELTKGQYGHEAFKSFFDK